MFDGRLFLDCEVVAGGACEDGSLGVFDERHFLDCEVVAGGACEDGSLGVFIV